MQIQCQAVLPSSLSVLPFSQTEALKLSLNRNSVVVTYVSLSSVSSLSLCLRHLACLQRSTLTPPLSQPDFSLKPPHFGKTSWLVQAEVHTGAPFLNPCCISCLYHMILW